MLIVPGVVALTTSILLTSPSIKREFPDKGHILMAFSALYTVPLLVAGSALIKREFRTSPIIEMSLLEIISISVSVLPVADVEISKITSPFIVISPLASK